MSLYFRIITVARYEPISNGIRVLLVGIISYPANRYRNTVYLTNCIASSRSIPLHGNSVKRNIKNITADIDVVIIAYGVDRWINVPVQRQRILIEFIEQIPLRRGVFLYLLRHSRRQRHQHQNYYDIYSFHDSFIFRCYYAILFSRCNLLIVCKTRKLCGHGESFLALDLLIEVDLIVN